MDTSRGYMNCATLLGKIYAPGGGWQEPLNDGTGGFTNVWLASVEVYHPDSGTGTWSYIAPLSAPRATAYTAAVRGKLYVVGGYTAPPTVPMATEVYDPMNPNAGWITLSHTLGRQFMGGATSMGNIYVIGGQEVVSGGGGVDDADVSVFSDDASKWNYVAPMDTSRNGAVCVALGGETLYCGGCDRRDQPV